MADEYEMPDATRSAMAASTDLSFGSDRTDPPTADVRGFVDPIRELITRDPEANRAFADLTAGLESFRAEDRIDVDTLRSNPVRLMHLAAHAPVHIREAPFDYADKDGGNALMTPNAATANLGVVGKAGSLGSSMGDVVGGTCWTGNAVTNDSVGSQPNQRVRITPWINWHFFWDLAVVGLPDGIFVGSDPWANCRVGLNVSTWDEFGNNVANSGPRELFFRHHSGSPGATVNTISGAETGFVYDLYVFFSIPPKKVRWVNVDASFELRTRYNSFANQAFAVGSYNVEVVSYIMRPAAPDEE